MTLIEHLENFLNNTLALAYIFLICRLRSKSLFLIEMVVPKYLHCSTIGIFDLPGKKDGELTFNYFLLKHKENNLDPLYSS